MKLIKNWRQWPRMYSQWAFITIGAIQMNVLAFVTPEHLAAPTLFLPDTTWGQFASGITAALAVSGFIGRLIHQGINGVSDEPLSEASKA